MTSLGIVDSGTLMGKEIKQILNSDTTWWQELTLMSRDPDEAGTLTEVQESARLVEAFEPDRLSNLDLAFVCGSAAGLEDLLEDSKIDTRLILVGPEEPAAATIHPIVAGINLPAIGDRRILRNPHSAVILLSHLLHPLAELGVEAAHAWMAQPVSVCEKEGMDELFEQTRSILAFSSDLPQQIFGTQMAFNLLPTQLPTDSLADQVSRVLDQEIEIALDVLQAGIFHGVSLSVLARCRSGTKLEEVGAALLSSGMLEMSEDSATLGPVAAAGADKILLGEVRPAARVPGGFWIRCAADNLRRGGALNAVESAKALCADSG